jgi:peroxiredoxin Q/BCP
MVLEPGASVPTLRATNQWGETVEPAFQAPTVVYFYPEDDTSGCTIEATQFNEYAKEQEAVGVTVYGVSTDTVESHCDFAEEHGLAFDLLADPDGKLAEAFDVDLVDGRAGRTTFVVVDGQVVAVYEGVRPDGHAAEVVRDLREVGLLPTSEQ